MHISIERNQLLTFGLPLAIVLFSVLLALSSYSSRYPELAMGITYDLTLTAPLVYYFLIRKKSIPKITVVPFMVAGTILAAWVLPGHQQYHLHLVTTWLLPAVELTLLGLSFYQVYKTIKAFRQSPHAADQDFYVILKESTIKAMGNPRLGKILATEAAMFYYAFFSWKPKKAPANSFTNFRENGISALLGVILFMLIVETGIVHILVAKWNETVAWVLTAGSFYVVIQIFAHIKALRHRVSYIQDGCLVLKYGLFGDIRINLNCISRVELTTNEIAEENRKAGKLALLPAIESHNVILYFAQPQTIEKPYGMTKSCDTLLLHIDDKQAFAEKLNGAKDLITSDN